MRLLSRFNLTIAGIAVLAFILDRLTKIWAADWLMDNGPVSVISGLFAFRYAENTGIAFSLLRNHPGIVQMLSPVVFIVLLVFFFRSMQFSGVPPFWQQLSFGLIIGGALGNLYDRIRFQYVIDFLDAYIGSHHWPTFNVADSCICVGVVILLALVYVSERNDKRRVG